MPLQNRVTPLGELVAEPARGLVYGNRGCLHDEAGRIRRRYAVRRWIACRLVFKDWHRAPLLQPGKFTELFFLDEATSFAAGHRPCALCRRVDYERFSSLWLDLHGEQGADTIDERLHAERVEPDTRRHRLHEVELDELPDGAFVLRESRPMLVFGRALLAWTPGGYTGRSVRPTGRTMLVTPPSLVEVLRRGWTSDLPLLHPSARAGACDRSSQGG